MEAFYPEGSIKKTKAYQCGQKSIPLSALPHHLHLMTGPCMLLSSKQYLNYMWWCISNHLPIGDIVSLIKQHYKLEWW